MKQSTHDSFKKMADIRVKVPQLSYASLRRISVSDRPLFTHKQNFFMTEKMKAKTGNTLLVNAKNPTAMQRDFERVMEKYRVRTPEQARWSILFTQIFEILRLTTDDVKDNADMRKEFYTDLKAVERFEVYLADKMIDECK